jgi:hypothetical protein
VHAASFLATAFPHWSGLRCDHMTFAEHQFTVDLTSTRRFARCPTFHWRSGRAHSWFTRALTDVPLGMFAVCLRVHARRYRCLNAACPRQTFRECLPDVAPAYQRRTPALRQRLETVAFALGGQAGHRLLHALYVGTGGTSRNSLLRLVRRAEICRAVASDPPVRVLASRSSSPDPPISPYQSPVGRLTDLRRGRNAPRAGLRLDLSERTLPIYPDFRVALDYYLRETRPENEGGSVRFARLKPYSASPGGAMGPRRDR